MSTISVIGDRPASAPKEPVYPRLLRYTYGPSKFIVLATGPGRSPSTFTGTIVSVEYDPDGNRPVGYTTDTWGKSVFADFDGMVSLYNK